MGSIAKHRISRIMTQPIGILFDLDSTLIDSSAAVRGAWIQLAQEAGFDPRNLIGLHGIPADGCLRILLPNHSDDQIQAWVARIEELEIDTVEAIRPISGAPELLAELDLRNIPWAIVTSCTAPLAAARLAASGIGTPQQMVTFSDVTHGKPHPEPFLLGAARLNLHPSQCWVIEDAHSGVTAGKSAGCKVAAVLTTHTRQELPHADFHMESLLDLLTLIG